MTSQYLQQLNATTIGSGGYLIPISDPGSGRLLKITKDNLFNGLYIQSSGYLNMNAHSLTLSNDMTFNQALTTTSSPIFNNLIASGVVDLCSITNSGIIDIRAGYNSDINVYTSGASSYIHFQSVSGAGLNFNRIDMNDQGNRFVYYSNGSLRWTFGQLGDGTDNYILYNNTLAQNAWSANYSTNVVNINQLTVSGISLGVSAPTSLNQNLRYSDSPTFNGITASGNVFVNGTLTSLGAFNASGNMTFGDMSTDIITQNASGRYLPYGEVITMTSSTNTAEVIQTWQLSDDPSGFFKIMNSTSTNNIFAPKMQGYHGGAGVGMLFEGRANTDTGVNAVLQFTGQINTSDVVVRPVLNISNRATPLVEVTSSGVLNLKAAPVTFPTATTDIVSIGGFDKAAADRRLYIQSEAGSSISLGNDRLSFLSTSGIIAVNGTDISQFLSTGISGTWAGNPISSNLGGLGVDTSTATQGSILYKNATVWTTAAAGASGQVLATQGTSQNPKWINQSKVLLGTASVNAQVASVNMTLVGSGNYKAYIVEMTDVIPSVASVFWMRTSANNTTYDAGTSYSYSYIENASATTSAAAAQVLLAGNTVNVSPSGTQGGLSGRINIWNPSGVYRVKGTTEFSSSSVNDGISRACYSSFMNKNVKPVQSIQFLFSTGNVASGEFRLYGLTNN